MIIERLKKTKEVSDEEFDCVYPSNIQLLSDRHWTPVNVAMAVTDFLCFRKGLKILDIGSGVGKFCLVGASVNPGCEFYGVEFRENFIGLANKIKETYRIKNVNFLKSDILEINFSNYDGIYFFNSFQERIDDTAAIDNHAEISGFLYKEYTQYLFNQFQQMPIGTRLATYHSPDFYIPGSYRLVGESFNNMLKFYIQSKENKEFGFELNEEKVNKHILRNAF